MLITNEPIKDIGRVKFGQVHTFDFHVTNTGDKVIRIKKLQVGCSSCTVAKIKKPLIGPGETAVINVEFTPGTISKQRKHIDVLYDDTSLKLEFRGESYG